MSPFGDDPFKKLFGSPSQKTSDNTTNNKPPQKSQPKRYFMSSPSIIPILSMMNGGSGGGSPFGMENKKPELNELIDSDDDYDMSTEVYATPNILKIDADVNEIKLDIKSIDDLIELGLKFKSEKKVDNHEKKDEKNINTKKNKKSKSGEDILNETDLSEVNDISSLINIAFDTAIKQFEEENNRGIKNAEKKIETTTETEKVNKKTPPSYYEYNGKKYSVDINKIVNLIEPLKKLKNMIGMKNIKENILEMILYYIQNFEVSTSDMLHTAIEGPPGVGKTKLGRILAQVYHGLGVIPSTRFKRVRRTDLIGKYLGHTAHKTQEVIDEAEGGVLFIDEAYSLGASGGEKDIYSKECIDTINMNLTEKKKNLIVIIAGYSDQLDASFFAVNEGLKRRFPFRFKIKGYDESEMKDIFYAQIRRMKWKLDPEVSATYLEEFFKKNKKDVPHFGGDIETIILNCKMTHAKRVIGKPNIYHKILNIDDIDKAFTKFKNNKKKEDTIDHLYSMYT
jgi:SpoVK/Ycf46/Vps4 family AAA+-type ATPase